MVEQPHVSQTAQARAEAGLTPGPDDAVSHAPELFGGGPVVLAVPLLLLVEQIRQEQALDGIKTFCSRPTRARARPAPVPSVPAIPAQLLFVAHGLNLSRIILFFQCFT